MAPITGLKEVPVSIPKPGATGKLVFGGYRSLLVRIDTDDGITGVGEGLVRLAPRATMEIVNDLAAILRGRDPMETEVIWDDLYATMLNRGHNRGYMLEAIAAIDTALWDIKGKALGQPIYRLLGGSDAGIPCYASSVRLKAPEEAAQDARSVVDAGFKAVKLKIGRGRGRLGEDMASVSAVRDAIGPDVELMVDANCAYKYPEALKMARHLEAVNAAWFEEPVAPNDLHHYRQLRDKVDVPIAAGETWFTRYDFREALQEEAIDVAQPDVSRAGGITETWRIAQLASSFHVTFAPHTGQSSIVCLVAAIHLAASAANTRTYEFIALDWSNTTENPLRASITGLSLEDLRTESTVRPPQDPGLGLEVDWGALEPYIVREG